MPNKNNIIVIGSLNVVFVHSYAISFKERGYNVLVVDIGKKDVPHDYLLERGIDVVAWNREGRKNSRIKNLVKKVFKLFKFDRIGYMITAIDSFERNHIHALDMTNECKARIMEFDPDCVFYIWSTTVYNQKAKIESFFADSSLQPASYLAINTYPVRANYTIENAPQMDQIDREFFDGFDLILYSSRSMESLFIQMGYHNNNSIIYDDRLNPCYFVLEDVAEARGSDNVRVIFLGNTNFSLRTIDDVRRDLNFMAAAGLEVWIQRPSESAGLHTAINFFDPFNYEDMVEGRLAMFIRGFDGVYMGFNQLNNARSNVSFPTRFALAMTGGIPIFLERDNWTAVKERFRDLVPIVEFDSVLDIASYFSIPKDICVCMDTEDYSVIFYAEFDRLVNEMEKVL